MFFFFRVGPTLYIMFENPCILLLNISNGTSVEIVIFKEVHMYDMITIEVLVIIF